MPNGFIDELERWEEEAKSWLSREEEARTKLEALQAPLSGLGRFVSWASKITPLGLPPSYHLIPLTIVERKRAMAGKPPLLPTPESVREYQIAEQTDIWVDTVNKTNRANFFTTLYHIAPMGIATGRISNFDDFMALLPGGISEGALSDEDIIQAEDIINSMLAGEIPITPAGVTPELAEEMPEWLEVSPEEQAKVTEFLMEPMPTRPTFKGVHLTTVDEMIKYLTKQVSPPELPLGTTPEQLLAASTKMGLTEEQIASTMEYDEMVGILGVAWEEQQRMIDDVKAGIAKYEIPEMTGKEMAKYVALQPLQAIADVILPYLKYVNYPMSGLASHTAYTLGPYTPSGFIERRMFGVERVEEIHEAAFMSFEKVYADARATNNWWMAYGKAWEDFDMNWGAKLAIEILVDPLTYIGFGIYTKATRPFGALGRGVAAFEYGFNYVFDIPFQAMKTGWGKLPKVTSQIVRQETNKFIGVANSATRSHVARFKGALKITEQLTREDIIDAAKFSIRRYNLNPSAEDMFADYGRYLTSIPPVTTTDIMAMTKQLDGKLLFSELTERTIDDVNNLVMDIIAKRGGIDEATNRLFPIVMADGAKSNNFVKAKLLLIKRAGQFNERLLALERLETPAEMMVTMTNQQRKIIQMTAASDFYKSRMTNGIIAGLMNHVAWMESNIWRRVLDRWVVHPLASAYLGFPAYPVWNAIEDMFRSTIEGVLPRQMTLEHFQLLTININIREARLLTGKSSDIVGMLGSTPGKGGAVSFLPGAVPEIARKIPIIGEHVAGKEFTLWLGRNWIELSNIWGNAFRRNFAARKYLQILAGRSRNVFGKDMNKLLDDVTGTAPRITRIKAHDLKQEIIARAQTLDPDIVRDMKNVVSDKAISQQEQLKILRLANELTPGARGIGEQMIASGEAIKNPANFAKILNDKITADFAARPGKIADHFNFMADGILAEEIKSSGDLMQVFQHLKVMEDTLGDLPHRMMSGVYSKTDELMARGKYGKVIRDLWTDTRTEMIDALNSCANANARVRNKILASIPDANLTNSQEYALRELLEHGNIRDMLKDVTLRQDGELLDEFWRRPAAERTHEAHLEIRSERRKLWDAFEQVDADYFGNENLMRRNLAELYSTLPRTPVLSVDATNRALVPNDVARAMGCNVDSLNTAITEVITFQERRHFVSYVQKITDADPTNFKGFTKEKLDDVYHIILDNMHFKPEVDIQLQKVGMQIEGLRQDMMNLKGLKGLTPDEETAVFRWIDDVADKVDETFYEEVMVKPLAKPPIAPAKRFLKSEYKDWNTIRQESWDDALKEYYKAYTDYSHENIIDHVMKHIFPYWTYESQRWFFLPRTFIRRPGVWAAWGKYNEYSEYGYMRLPGIDLQLNPARGSVFGVTFALTRRDYPYYYKQLGPAAEFMDLGMRYGFYPGAHFMLPITTLPLFTGRPPNWGETMPALYKTGLNILVGSNIPGVAENAQWLTDHMFHENFRDYKIVTKISTMQVEAGGTLIGGQSGRDLWDKRMKNFGKFAGEYGIWGISDDEIALMELRMSKGLLSPEEIEDWNTRFNLAKEEGAVWSEAARDIAWLGLLMENVTIFRFRPEEMEEAFDRVGKLIEAQTGLTLAEQDHMFRHNIRPGDVVPMTPDLRRAMNQIWEYRLYLGRPTTIRPQAWSELDVRTTEFWKRVDVFQADRVSEQERTNTAFLQPTPEEHLDRHEWRQALRANWDRYADRYNILRKSPEYADVPITLDERVEVLKKEGRSLPVATMFDEVLRIYFSIEPKLKKDPDTGEKNIDWVGFYIEREAVRMALPENLRAEFDSYIREYETPLEGLFRDVTNTYFRGYWAVQQIVLQQYTPQERAMISEYHADRTTLERKREIEATISPTTGRQLISGYRSQLTNARIKLRMVSPKLDFCLYVFGYVSVPKTDEALAMVNAWEADRMSLLY